MKRKKAEADEASELDVSSNLYFSISFFNTRHSTLIKGLWFMEAICIQKSALLKEAVNILSDKCSHQAGEWSQMFWKQK